LKSGVKKPSLTRKEELNYYQKKHVWAGGKEEKGCFSFSSIKSERVGNPLQERKEET